MNSEACVCEANRTPVFSLTQNTYLCLELKASLASFVGIFCLPGSHLQLCKSLIFIHELYLGLSDTGLLLVQPLTL